MTRMVPRRPARATLPAVLAIFFGGAAIGPPLAMALAPGSSVAAVLSFLLLPSVLVFGFYGWLGVAIVLAIPHGLARLAGRTPPAPRASEDVLPSGEWLFLPIGATAGFLTGLVVGLISTRPVAVVLPIYLLVGAAYGAILVRLARTGLLPFPGSE